MKRIHDLARGLLLFGLALQTFDTFGQGSLTPPGPPGPTMKTLDQVEPRRPISALPFVITNSGSYYLASNLTGVSGIIISNTAVTLDLSGFTLLGQGVGSAIFIASGRSNIVIRNGFISGWGNFAIQGDSAGGVVLEGLCASSLSSGAVTLSDRATVRDCAFDGNFVGIGLLVGADSLVQRVAVANFSVNAIVAGAQSRITDCRIKNGNFAISTGESCSVENCFVNTTGNMGIRVGDNSTVLNCAVTGTLSIGIRGTNNVTIRGALVGNNLSRGISVSDNCRIVDCAVSGNGSNGVEVASACVVMNNHVTQNTNASGIRVSGFYNRIEGNHTYYNKVGITVVNTVNLITGNSAFNSLSGTNLSVAAGNASGMTNFTFQVTTNTVPHANFIDP